MRVYLEKLSKYDRPQEPLTVAVPFPKGGLLDIGRLAVFDGDRVLPTQARATARWPDGSVKWGLFHFLADLPGNRGKHVEIRRLEDGVDVPETPLRITAMNKGLIVDTGVLRFALNGPGRPGLFGDVCGSQFNLAGMVWRGPTIQDEQGRDYEAVIDVRGWQLRESGPVRAVLEAAGKHYNASGETRLDFELRLTAFAGKPWLMVDYRIINREPVAAVTVNAVEFHYYTGQSGGARIRTAVATSNYATDMITGDGREPLNKLIDGDYLLYDMNEHIPETFYGTFFADWNHPEQGGVCLTQYQAYQNFPKSLTVDASGITVGILPQESPALVWPRGVAKTHRLFWHFHSGDESLEQLNARSLQFQCPDRPALQPEVYRDCGLFEDVFVDAKLDGVERILQDMADYRIRAYGLLHWGDAPDPGYTQQGRGNGELVWTNNEYDFPHAAMLLYAKTAERRFLDYLLVSARHQLDVDVCHSSDDPLRIDGQMIHSAGHVSGYVALCHQWVEGLLDFYHQTGDEDGLKTALGIGENILRQLERPRYQGEGGINARETGWALRALVALYRETGDARWLGPAERIIGHFEAWKRQYGGWLAPYTDHTDIRVPFMIAIAVGSLMRYDRICPEARIKGLVVAAVDDLLENCLLENGLFYYKELPSLRRSGTNPLVLEALAYAYELTGNKRYLEAGLATFHTNLTVKSGEGSKRLIGDAVISWSGDGPKRFAQAFPVLAYYYRAARQAGVL